MTGKTEAATCQRIRKGKEIYRKHGKNTGGGKEVMEGGQDASHSKTKKREGKSALMGPTHLAGTRATEKGTRGKSLSGATGGGRKRPRYIWETYQLPACVKGARIRALSTRTKRDGTKK